MNEVFLIERATTADVDFAVSSWRARGNSVRVIRGHRMKTAITLYSEISAAYQFPLQFQPTPVSVRDYLLKAPDNSAKRPRILVITQAQKIYSGEKSTLELHQILEALIDASSGWESVVQPTIHRAGINSHPFRIYLTGIDVDDQVRRMWTEAGATVTKSPNFPHVDPTTQEQSDGEGAIREIRTGFNAMSTLAGFAELSGARWRSNASTTQMLHLGAGAQPSGFDITLGVWFPALGDGGLPERWSDCHLLTSARDLDPDNSFRVEDALDSHVSYTKVERFQQIGRIFDALVLPTFSLCADIEDLKPEGRGRQLLQTFRVTSEAAELLEI